MPNRKTVFNDLDETTQNAIDTTIELIKRDMLSKMEPVHENYLRRVLASMVYTILPQAQARTRRLKIKSGVQEAPTPPEDIQEIAVVFGNMIDDTPFAYCREEDAQALIKDMPGGDYLITKVTSTQWLGLFARAQRPRVKEDTRV